MDLATLTYVVLLALCGVAYDAYENPKSMVVEVVAPGGNTVPSLDRAFVATIVESELNRMSRVHSLIARPEIRPSDDKTTIEAIADALGGGALMTAFSGLMGKPPSVLKVGLFNEADKPVMLVAGTQRTIPVQNMLFDNVLPQEAGESIVDLIKRSAIDGAARIDPYLAMIYLLTQAHHTGDDRFAAHALQIATRSAEQLPKGRSVLLARLFNVEGLVFLIRGDFGGAAAAFSEGLDRLLPTDHGPTYIVMNLNAAFVEIAQGNPRSAADRVTALLRAGGALDGEHQIASVTTEGTGLVLGKDEVEFLRSTAYMIGGAAALAQKDVATAERMTKQALAIDPKRITAIALQEDIATRRGDVVLATKLHASIHDLQFTATPYIETANAFATLSFAGETVKVAPSLYFDQ